MPEVRANGLTLHYESLGRDGDPVILLVMGLAMQMIVWPDALCEMLVAMGLRVLRFDNRDVGLSTHLAHLGAPNVAPLYMRYLLRLPLSTPYRIDDMADDTIGLIVALQLERPHIVGASMGGMIAQNVAARFPDKIASLTSIMSTTGRRSLPQPLWETRRAILQPPPRDEAGAIERMKQIQRMIGRT